MPKASEPTRAEKEFLFRFNIIIVNIIVITCSFLTRVTSQIQTTADLKQTSELAILCLHCNFVTAEQFLCIFYFLCIFIRETIGRREQELREPAARFCQSIEKKFKLKN